MKKGNPEKKNNEREEKNWWEGDIQKSDETSLEENLEMARKTGTRLIVSALVFAVILIALICIAIMQWNLRGEDDTETSGTITVTGNPDMTVRLENTSAETETDKKRSKKNTRRDDNGGSQYLAKRYFRNWHQPSDFWEPGA